MEKIVYVRICRDGGYHRGDLGRLSKVKGSIVEVVAPNQPRGRVMVRLELEPTAASGADWKKALPEEMTARPPTFHP